MVEALQLSPNTNKWLIRKQKKIPDHFRGGFGKIDVEPVNIGAKKDSKPQKSKVYPIPKAYKGTTQKERK